MEIMQIAAIGILGAVLSIMLKSYRPEFSVHVVLATALVIFLMILKELEVVLAIITSISNQVSLSKIYFPVIFKILGVCYLADFTAQVCKDAGEGAIASKIEFAGKIIIVYLALPVFLSVIDLINNLLP